MIVHKGYNNLQFKDPVVTIGIFDGVHRGHRSLIEFLSSVSKKTRGESVVITFSPHPRLVIGDPSAKLSVLTTIEEKIALIEKAGCDHLVIIDFTPEFSRMNACDFVENVLVKAIGTNYLVVGHDHHFGYKGGGDFDTISKCAGSMNFRVDRINGLAAGGGVISSSIIRKALLEGRLGEANEWLGYSYTLKGIVVKGKKLGRELGFPTANILPTDEHKLIPADGVYAVDVVTGSKNHSGMLSIGKNPTVNRIPGNTSVEVNIFDFEGDIYGEETGLIFRHRMRDEIKFTDTEMLKQQMMTDREVAIKLLK